MVGETEFCKVLRPIRYRGVSSVTCPSGIRGHSMSGLFRCSLLVNDWLKDDSAALSFLREIVHGMIRGN
jgi:hypothetical protein